MNDLSFMSHTLEEITDEFMINVVLFFVKFQLKDSFDQFLDEYFPKRSLKTDQERREDMSLRYTESINEENLQMRNFDDERKDPQPRKSAFLRRVTYKSPFVKLYSHYCSQMQMDLRFKYFICKQFNLSDDCLVAEERAKANSVNQPESEMNNLDSKPSSHLAQVEKVSYSLERSIPMPGSIHALTKRIIKKNMSVSVRIKAIALSLHSKFFLPVNHQIEKLSEVRFCYEDQRLSGNDC